jgi:hypothetical protein
MSSNVVAYLIVPTIAGGIALVPVAQEQLAVLFPQSIEPTTHTLILPSRNSNSTIIGQGSSNSLSFDFPKQSCGDVKKLLRQSRNYSLTQISLSLYHHRILVLVLSIFLLILIAWSNCLSTSNMLKKKFNNQHSQILNPILRKTLRDNITPPIAILEF